MRTGFSSKMLKGGEGGRGTTFNHNDSYLKSCSLLFHLLLFMDCINHLN